jgi:citrate lyase subunit beta/citryl-CoA lyase
LNQQQAFCRRQFPQHEPRLIGLTWGPEDLSAELGAETNRDAQGELTEPYRLARSVCLYAAAVAKVPAIETVYVDFRNSDGLRRDTKPRAAMVSRDAWPFTRLKCR